MAFPAKIAPDALLATALDIVASTGGATLGIRVLADRLGVRPSSLYKHCAGLPALHALLAEHVARELRTRLEVGVASGTTTATLVALCRTYVAYAAEHPEHYALLLSPIAMSDNTVPGVERKALWNTLLRAVSETNGRTDDTAGAVAVWSFVHGFAVLAASGAFGASGPHEGLERGIAALTRGL